MRRRFKLLPLILALALLLSGTAEAADYPELRAGPQQISVPFTETPVETVSGGNVLRGLLTKPTEAEGKLPVAILLHGLATDRRWCDDLAWALADNGIASVRFDFDGTGLSDGRQEDMTISSEVRDTVAILSYVESLDWADTDNVFLVGKSMGGVDAVLAAQGRGDEIKAMCLWYPGFAVTALARRGFLLGERFNPWDPPETVTVSGYAFGREFIKEVQALDCAAACRKYTNPVLILHGTADIVAPIFPSFAMAEEFPDCRLEVIPGGGHGFWGFQELFALDSMVQFLREQIEQ